MSVIQSIQINIFFWSFHNITFSKFLLKLIFLLFEEEYLQELDLTIKFAKGMICKNFQLDKYFYYRLL